MKEKKPNLNLFESEELPFTEELTTVLYENPKMRVERILSMGQASPEGFWYDQEELEWLTLLTGDALIEYEDGRAVTLHTGEMLTIEPHERHRVAYTSVEPLCTWLCVFLKEC